MSDTERDSEAKNSSDCSNRYELIMVAAKEARRLNDYYRIRNVEPKSRITTEAIHRARGAGVRFMYGAPQVPGEREDTTPASPENAPAGDE